MTIARYDSLENQFDAYEPDVEILINEAVQSYVPNPLEAFEDYKRKTALKIKKNFIDEFHILRDGYTFIGNNNPSLKDKLKTSPEIKNKLRNPVEVKTLLNEGKTFQDILEWTNEDLIDIYALASDLFEQKQFYESSAILKLLCLIKPTCHQFWLKSGEALEADRKLREALASHYGGISVNPYSYDSYYHICQILGKLNERDKALAIIDEVKGMIAQADDPNLASLKSNLEQLANHL